MSGILALKVFRSFPGLGQTTNVNVVTSSRIIEVRHELN